VALDLGHQGAVAAFYQFAGLVQVEEDGASAAGLVGCAFDGLRARIRTYAHTDRHSSHVHGC